MKEAKTKNLDFNEQINLRGMYDKYAFIVIDRWVQALKRHNIGVTGQLMNSFTKELKRSGGNVEAVIFKFSKYGRFPDMGVGNGTSLNERVLNRKFDKYRNSSGKSTGGLKRRKKPWYTKTLYREVAKLSDLLRREYGEQIVSLMEKNFGETITLTA